ncbi:MarR family winged helix-turn-helix transcriptional regulator [Planktosalinus lacus]|uniref:MarR family transcriptional regulator n=1 Tax=Planktosalinus lacus TaxID=1526573 RepID=A0A8J2V987_9FLAO|nr:MarR family transcriptional regulator [Planktosalinus lacus]GGD88686.1 MarR family transcriptional regulator [Planktosalinus lacus]
MTIEEAIKSSIPLKPHTRTTLNIMYSSRLVEEKIAELLKPYKVSMQQYNVLRILRGQKGIPANLSTIQERMINKMSNTTRLVDKLIEKKLADRTICESNRRKVEIIITPKGLELLLEIDPLMAKCNEDILKLFSLQELNTLNNLLDKLK